MGIIRKDFKYKIIKNFLTKEEVKLLNSYCDIKHRTNLNTFELSPCSNFDTGFYGDPVMESLMLNKKNILESATGKKLLPTYSYWRMYTKYADLKKHSDRPSCEISATVNIGGDIDWPIFMDGKKLHTKEGDACIYLGCEIEHWREEFLGDWCAQVFLHYVDADGPNKKNHLDGRLYWGLDKE
jgi:hypothetical protein